MKLRSFIVALVLLCAWPINAFATQTWIVIGDSISSSVPGGTASQLWTHLVSAERDVVFKNISSGGNALGKTDYTGYYNQGTIDAINIIGGYYIAYDGIIVFAGTNDFSRSVPWADTSNGLRGILAHVRAINTVFGTNKKVLVLDPIYRSDENTPNSLGNTLNTYRYFEWLLCTTPPSYPASDPETGGYSDICFYGSRGDTIMGASTALPYLETTTPRIHPTAAGHRYLATWVELEAQKAKFTTRNPVDGTLITTSQPLF